MKKILLVGMLVLSGLSFGRDLEYRETQEWKEVTELEGVHMVIPARMNMERMPSELNQHIYSGFHKELDSMNRGHDNR